MLNKSGIYLWKCDDCHAGYIGQTKRNLKTRWSEHRREYEKDSVGISAIADHTLDQGHNCFESGLKLLKEISNPSLLDAYESIYIHKMKKENRFSIKKF